MSNKIEAKEKELKFIQARLIDRFNSQKEDLQKLRSELEKMEALDDRPKLESAKKMLERELGELEESIAQRRKTLKEELEALIEETSHLEQKLLQERQESHQALRTLDNEKSFVLGEAQENLGNLEKTIELTKKYYQEQMDAFEARKNELLITMDHARAVFEALIDEKKKDLSIAIDGLKIKIAKGREKFTQDEVGFHEAIRKTQKDKEDLERTLQKEREDSERSKQSKELEFRLVESQTKEQIEKLELRLQTVRHQADQELSSREKELSNFERQSEVLPQELKRDWNEQLVKNLKEQEALKETLKKDQADFTQAKTGFENSLKALQDQLEDLKKREKEEPILWRKELADFEASHKKTVKALQENLCALTDQKNRYEIACQNRTEELEIKIDAFKKTNQKLREEFGEKCGELRASYNSEITKLRQDLEVFQQQVVENNRRYSLKKSELEKELLQRQKDFDGMKLGYETSKRLLTMKWDEEKNSLTAEIETLTVTLNSLKETNETALKTREKEVASLTEESERQEALAREELNRLKALCEREKASLEENLKKAITLRQAEALTLSNACGELEMRINTLVAEIGGLKSQMDEERSSLEKERSEARSQAKNERSKLAEEITNARRLYQEKIRQREQELYLLRLKADLRNRQLKEVLESKKRELALYEQGLSREIADVSELLLKQVQELESRRELLTGKMTHLESQKATLAADLGSLRAEADNFIVEDIEETRKRAKEKLAYFMGRAQGIIEAQEQERQKLLALAEQLAPVSRELYLSLEEWTINWDKEIRSLSRFLKGMEQKNGGI